MMLKPSLHGVAIKIAAEVGCSVSTASKWLKGKAVSEMAEKALGKALIDLGLPHWHPDEQGKSHGDWSNVT